jgi:putative FmdB family regulatory protein
MPTYDYECDACGHSFELFQGINEPVKKKCPACAKNRLRRLFGTGAAIVFKGSGFYQTDYRSESYKKAAASESKASESSGSESKGAEKGAPKGSESSSAGGGGSASPKSEGGAAATSSRNGANGSSSPPSSPGKGKRKSE